MADYTPAWKLHRKIVSKAFRSFLKGEALGDILHGSMTKVISVIKKENGVAFNPKQAIELTVFNFICALCFNTSYEFDNVEFITLMKNQQDMTDIFGNGIFEDLFPYLYKIWPSYRFKMIDQCLQYQLDWVNKHIADHRDTFKPDSNRDFTDHLFHARKEAEDEGNQENLENISDVHIRQTILDIFTAGIDTSRFTLYWALLLMAAYPEIQTKCQDEIDAVVGKGRLPSPSDKQYLPYVDATLHEIMRFRTVAPLGVPHAAAKDNATLGGYDIRKGTMVFINHGSLHMSENVWKNPDVFDPTRFLDADGSLAPTPSGWLPFSAGRRTCLGETVAKPELVTLFATFLQQFRITPPIGEKPDIDLGGNSFGCVPKEYKIVMAPRV